MTLDAELHHARTLLRTGRTAESVLAFERVIGSWPRSAEARGAYALALWETDRLSEADAAALAALAIDAESPSAHCARGLVAQSTHDPATALAHFDRSLTRRPDFVLALVHAAVCAR